MKKAENHPFNLGESIETGGGATEDEGGACLDCEVCNRSLQKSSCLELLACMSLFNVNVHISCFL